MPNEPIRVARSSSARQDVNRLAVVPAPLCFTISRYRDYDCYAWSKFYHNADYGEIGHGRYHGDPQAVEPLRDGYVYVYRDEGGKFSLWKVFKVTGGQYQEVDARGPKVAYESSRGPARDHARIEGYFPGEHGIPMPIVIIDSDIKLSEPRLRGEAFSLDKNPKNRGSFLHLSRSRMQLAPENPSSGPAILAAYRRGQPGPDLITYDLQRKTFQGEPGVDIRVPHAFRELERRNARYRERVERHQKWLNDETRNKEAYIHQTIAAVLKQDASRKSKIDEAKFQAWQKNDLEAYRLHFFPVHYAIEDLVRWLDDPLLREWLLDYNRSDDDDIQEAGLAAYVAGIRDLALTAEGRDHLRKQLQNDASFFNLATHIPAIRRDYVDPAAHSNFAVEVRKVSNVVFAGLQEFAGLLVQDNPNASLMTRLSAWASAKGVTLRASSSRAAKFSGAVLAHVDVEHLTTWARGSGKFATSVQGRSIISCFEVLNFGIAIKGVADAYQATSGANNTNLYFSLLNAAGATADIAASGLLEKYTSRIIQQQGWKASRIYYLAVFSGMVDCIVGIRSASQEWASGDLNTAVGWMLFSVGGLIVAAGGVMQVSGATLTVGSGGTAVVPGGAVILAGFVVEAIGLAWIWLANDDELDEWLIQSRFGRRTSLTSLDAEIEVINTLMCKFEVDVEFVSDRHARIVVEPRLFTDDSKLEITNLHSHAEGRLMEYLFGDRHDQVIGMAGLGTEVADPQQPRKNVAFARKNGRITSIAIDVYGTQDIDALRGRATLEVGPGGYIHGYHMDFMAHAGMWAD